ncbi:DNA (cytosine-5)-methyltransferase 1 [Rhodovulum sulfidophilum]|uniref:DNA (cytosine-5-)-methyltransferase n=1 Tax=Rhodovulum sulfidophilum TaxID=35806 RepID=UPI0005A953A7|nr:DNA (cytosine-5-)-methyltransferase [Rhodovulum sulfidophilum]ANB32757.1 DNA cytosine methyltransferase [Rhodovulum sulfidophilum DSM 1374]ANB36606.1 DNA cytosine methyltransferase [Rhodovulum sulfidophilum]MCW2303240.1 DNA (cytosine-5)-methyltransferase 1 [Rhodovulum sulfidophilum]NDK36934.1 DNA (cytosine-5-)-methyltransferase [Rhodovulum sulfidophilum]
MQADFSTLLAQAGYTVPEAARLLGYSEGHIYRWKRGEEIPRESVIRLLNMEIERRRDAGDAEKAFTFIDLFAGIGGLRRAMESAGGRCIFTSERDKYAQQTYMANFPDNRLPVGDIREVEAEDIPAHDVLVAGFPCQPFSIAGVSKKNALGRAHGFEDETQGTLFFDVLRILMHHRPAGFMLENVKNLKSHDKGRTFEVIRRKLTEELGYTLETRIIDAGHFVPQHRERIVMVGFRVATGFSFDDVHLPAYGTKRMRHILHPENGTEQPEGHFTVGPDAAVSDKYTLTDKLWAYLQGYAAKHKAKGNGFGFGMVDGDSISRTLSARYYKDGSEILVSRGEGNNPRRLTPRECARLMGYPDDFRIPVSDTQAYKQFGNSVAVPVFAEVAKVMAPHILSLTKAEPLKKVG